MGKRGPPPKPSAVKKLQGTYRKDRAPKKEMVPAPGVPQRPDWLDAEARKEWDRVVPQLAACGILSDVDGATLADYCAAHSLAVKATRTYQRQGLMIPGPNGVKAKHPMILVAKEARAQARLLAAEFGMSPSSRSRISEPDWKPGGAGSGTKDAAPTDKTEDFLFGRSTAKVIDGGAGK